MVALAATSTATPSLQPMLARSRLEAARREAQQAESTVRDLRAQVDAAENELEKRQGKVRSLSDQSRQSDPTYKSGVQRASADVPVKTQEFLFGLYQATSAKRQADGNGLKTDPAAPPVRNIQGQATGRIVNLSV